MEIQFKNYLLSNDPKRLNLEAIHGMLKDAYWCRNIPKATIDKAIKNSLCFGIYWEDTQVGFARVVTDQTTFAWLCDVIIAPQHRGLGLAKALMKLIVAHPSLQGLRRFCLATKDAHELYKQFGFKVSETPQNWMEIKNNDLYLQSMDS